MKQTFIILNPVQGRALLDGAVWNLLKAATVAGHRMELVVRPAKRSSEHNARLHAMLGWMSKHVPWAGAHRSVDEWKRLFVSAWLRAKNESVQMLPALDGHGIDIVYAPTSEMSGKQIAELIDWIYFWCAEQGHDLPEYVRDPQSGELVEVRRNV